MRPILPAGGFSGPTDAFANVAGKLAAEHRSRRMPGGNSRVETYEGVRGRVNAWQGLAAMRYNAAISAKEAIQHECEPFRYAAAAHLILMPLCRPRFLFNPNLRAHHARKYFQ